MPHNLNHKVFSIKTADFEALSIELFRFQYAHNPVYQDFVNALKVEPDDVQQLAQIPFLPVSMFKNYEVITTTFNPEAIFESSGTTGSVNSRHLVKDLDIYRKSFLTTFENFYGDTRGWCVIGLLPAYLERQHSSLVYMVEELVRTSGHPNSGFYLYDHEKLAQVLKELESSGQKTLLIGVTFALLDFAENYPMQLQCTTVMETGGMKGRRKELTREAVHDYLKLQFGVPVIHSEYGMTELLSQAYAPGDGIYQSPPWMKILLREEDDPLHIVGGTSPAATAISGVINVIDLANIYSCCFLATDDMGKLYPDGRFEVLGRIDYSDIRGCSLMIEMNRNL